jgi:hypothetical protein
MAVMSLQGVKLSLSAGCLLAAGAVLVSACGTAVDGMPVAAPGAGATEPSFPTARPIPPPRPTQPTPAPSVPETPAGAIPLPPNDNGYVFIETKSGTTRCQIASGNVGCEAPFTNSPLTEGEHANGVNISADGSVQWVLGNLGAIPTVMIEYRTYEAQGWTIAADVDGTRFTNDRTGHGMFVSIDKVDTF